MAVDLQVSHVQGSIALCRILASAATVAGSEWWRVSLASLVDLVSFDIAPYCGTGFDQKCQRDPSYLEQAQAITYKKNRFRDTFQEWLPDFNYDSTWSFHELTKDDANWKNSMMAEAWLR